MSAAKFFHKINADFEANFMIYNMNGECLNSEFRPKPIHKIKTLLISDHIYNTHRNAKISNNLIELLFNSPYVDLCQYATNKNFKSQLGINRRYPTDMKVAVAEHNDLQDVIDNFKPELVVILNDCAAVVNYINKLSIADREFKLWCILDTLSENVSEYSQYVETLNEADHLYVYSEGWKKIMEESGVSKPISVYSPGVDSRIYAWRDKESTREILHLPKGFTVISVNKNKKNKRYDLLIRAFVHFMAKYPENQINLLCICDNGEERGWCLGDLFINELQKNGLDVDRYRSSIFIAHNENMFTNEEINMFYGSSNVAISMSDEEGFNMFALECLSAGLPQVVTRVEGHVAFCNEENSTIVSVGDEGVDQAVAALEKYFKDPDYLERTKIAAIKSSQSWSWENGCAVLLDNIKEMSFGMNN
jgi:glycosyltransferase involved in cell wall biosynthesis